MKTIEGQTDNPAEIIYTLRNDYRSRSLEKSTVRPNPFEQFAGWLAEALADAPGDPNAMVLATASKDGRPSARVMLLRSFDRRGFVFFTNYTSRKGSEVLENPHASLLFFWPRLERQVRVEGVLAQTSRRVSEEYFATRPRESQIGAWASEQSRVIESRAALEAKVAALEEKFAGKKVPCPPHWGGYLLKPSEFEFWQGGGSRLHDRLRFTKAKSGWKIDRLSP